MKFQKTILALICFSSLAWADCLTAPFRAAQEFNLFVLGNLDHRQTDTEGRVAVGGNAFFDHYSLGEKIVGGESPYALIVGGDLSFSNGNIWGGAVAYGGALFMSDQDSTAFGGVFAERPLEFERAQSELVNFSLRQAGLKASGPTQISGKAIELTGEERGFNAFTIDGKDLAAASQLKLRVPAGATVLINVSGYATFMEEFGFDFADTAADHVLFNFAEAAKLRLRHVGIPGSVLAPRAQVEFTDGVIHGTLIAGSLQGNGQVSLPLFAGCLPSDKPGNP